MKTCKECNTALVLGDNWTEARAKQGKYLCKKCWHSRDMYVNGVYMPKSHPLFKPGKYKTFSDAAFETAYKIDNIKEGYVYVITNKAWSGWVKIGMAIDAEDRLSGYQTSSPHRDYVLEHSVWSNQRRKSEQQAHARAAILSEAGAGEWFKLPVDKAIEVLDNLDDYGTRAAQETGTDTPQNKLQERQSQGSLWDYAENNQPR
tara:strand:- start:37 stop:645 length:609 start_codon:yes stop_codon:yes gene_type:complete